MSSKRCWRYRCMNVFRGHRCFTRRSMPHPVEWYSSPGRVPKCSNCKCNTKWYYDKYRDCVELQKQVCHCTHAPYPHRRGTAASGGRWGAWRCVHHGIPF